MVSRTVVIMVAGLNTNDAKHFELDATVRVTVQLTVNKYQQSYRYGHHQQVPSLFVNYANNC